MGGPEERRRVVVGVSGSLGSLTALHRAAAEARASGAALRTVLAWEPPAAKSPTAVGRARRRWPPGAGWRASVC